MNTTRNINQEQLFTLWKGLEYMCCERVNAISSSKKFYVPVWRLHRLCLWCVIEIPLCVLTAIFIMILPIKKDLNVHKIVELDPYQELMLLSNMDQIHLVLNDVLLQCIWNVDCIVNVNKDDDLCTSGRIINQQS